MASLMLRTALRVSRRAAGTFVAAALAVSIAPVALGTAAAVDTVPTQLRGVQLHPLWSENTNADVDRQLDMLVEMNSTVLRTDLAWSSLMYAGRGVISSSYSARIDYLVQGAARRGIKVLPNIIETPCWASSAPADVKQDCVGAYWDRGVTKYPPTNIQDFADAVAYVAQRWGSYMPAIELWNEPNYNTGGYTTLNTPDRAKTYTAMVKAAYTSVKKVTPSLPVLAGAMSFADLDFLKALYANGIRGFYDGISVHPYNEWRAPGSAHDIAWAKYDLVQGMNMLHDYMLSIGDLTPMWITEFGYTTCTVGTGRWCITEAQQADYLARTVPIVAAWPWVRSFIVYNLRNKGTDLADGEHNFGLVKKDYTRKPAFAALGAAFKAADGATTVTAPVVTEPVVTEPVVTPVTTTTTRKKRRISARTAERLVTDGIPVQLAPAFRLVKSG
jgi:hypothetical protein